MMTIDKTSLILEMIRLRPEKDADLPLPQYMTAQAAGMDICAGVDEAFVLNPGQVSLIPTGIAVAIPKGFEIQVRPRSGLAAKYGIGIINSPGTIDADYRGEVRIALINFSSEPYTIHRGDRIAQLIISRVMRAQPKLVLKLDSTVRSRKGFGHTGIK
ncbi:MAG: dUTP diphosphatase [Desulfobacteraceae bacterium]|jgi:dUTP pyrophosphatase